MSDDLLKFLDESDEKREVLEDLLKTHFPILHQAIEEIERKEGAHRTDKRTEKLVEEAWQKIEIKFKLWRLIAEIEVQQDALTILHGVAEKIFKYKDNVVVVNESTSTLTKSETKSPSPPTLTLDGNTTSCKFSTFIKARKNTEVYTGTYNPWSLRQA